MITITFNAFSFLQPKLAVKGVGYLNSSMEIPEETTLVGLVAMLGLGEHEVESVFVNGRIVSWDQELRDSDRVALVPPGGTTGPHRFLLGMFSPRHEGPST